MLKKPLHCSANKFTLFIAAYFTLVFNYPFLAGAKKAIFELDTFDIGFLISVPLLLFFLLAFIFSLFSFKYLLKPLFITVTLLSSGVFYASLVYGIVFDYGMIQNVYETNNSEAFSYLNLTAVLFILVSGVLPAFIIYKVKITYQSPLRELARKVLFMLAMLTGILIIAFFYYQDFASVGRNNKFLKSYIVPTQYLRSGYKFIRDEFFTTPMQYQLLGQDAKVVKKNDGSKPNLVVVVVGETARSMNYEYNGYSKPTNAHTRKTDVISFPDVSSCGTATALSVPCMFSDMTRGNYDSKIAKHRDNALDVIQRAGVDVEWFDNDAGCKGVCKRVPNKILSIDKSEELCDGEYCYDEKLLSELDNKLQNIGREDNLIVLHVIGSHGPTYYRRYPVEHRQFVPDCPRSDIQNCTAEELVNTYDNTILYTDFILSQIIERLQAQGQDYNTAMLYISDHGESLGESGLYLHGVPYSFAPVEQTQVPMLMWLSDPFAQANRIDKQCLSDNAKSGTYSQDNFYHSLIGMMSVDTQDYDQTMDIFTDCTNTTNNAGMTQ